MTQVPRHVSEALNERFLRIGAALADLKISAQRISTVAERNAEQHAASVYTNRLAAVLIGINHLKDDVKRFAKSKGIPTKDVDAFCKASDPITLCAKAAETISMGLVGK